MASRFGVVEQPCLELQVQGIELSPPVRLWPESQTLELPDQLLPGPGAQLLFATRLGYAFSNRSTQAQVSIGLTSAHDRQSPDRGHGDDDMLVVAEEEATQDSPKIGAVSTVTTPYLQTGLLSIIHKSVGWLVRLFLGEMLTVTAMVHYDEQLAAGKKKQAGPRPCLRENKADLDQARRARR